MFSSRKKRHHFQRIMFLKRILMMEMYDTVKIPPRAATTIGDGEDTSEFNELGYGEGTVTLDYVDDVSNQTMTLYTYETNDNPPGLGIDFTKDPVYSVLYRFNPTKLQDRVIGAIQIIFPPKVSETLNQFTAVPTTAPATKTTSVAKSDESEYVDYVNSIQEVDREKGSEYEKEPIDELEGEEAVVKKTDEESGGEGKSSKKKLAGDSQWFWIEICTVFILIFLGVIYRCIYIPNKKRQQRYAVEEEVARTGTKNGGSVEAANGKRMVRKKSKHVRLQTGLRTSGTQLPPTPVAMALEERKEMSEFKRGDVNQGFSVD